MMGWLGGWQYRKSHVINSASGAGTGYQVRIKAHYGSGTDSGEDVYLNSHSRTDFGDVRFTDDDGVTLLDYWMEKKVDSDYAVFWVEVADDLSSSSATIYIYYGKSDATTTSNGDNTFIFFDDFETDLSKWTLVQSGGTVTRATDQKVQGSYSMKLDTTSNAEVSATATFLSQTSTFLVHLCTRKTNTDRRTGEYLKSSSDTYAILTVFQNDGTYEYNDGFVHDIMSYSADTWYETEIAPNVSTDTFDLWVDGEKKVDDGNFRNAVSNINKLRIYNQYLASHTTWIDVVYVRKYVDPEPSHGSWGSEETAGGQTYEVNVDAVVQSHATITKETIFNVEKDASVSGQSLTAQEVGFNVVRDALVQASVAMQVLGVYPFNVEALVGASADAQIRQTLGISRDAAVAVVSAPLFQSMFNVGSDAVLRVVAEAGVVKEGEVKVTRVFLVLGDLAIQIQGD